MALNTGQDKKPDSPLILLENLFRTVSFILDISVFKHSVFFLISSLNHLHFRVKAILLHGAQNKVFSIFSLTSCEEFDFWLEESLRNFSLIKTLSKERSKVKLEYHDWAFLQDDSLFQGLIDCLYALATRDFNCLHRIPSKFRDSGLNFLKTDRFLLTEVMNFNEIYRPLPESPSVDIVSRNSSVNILGENGNVIEADEMDGNVISSQLAVPIPEFSYSYGSPTVNSPDFSGMILTQEQAQTSEEVNLLMSNSKVKRKKKSASSKSFLESGGFIQPPALGNFPLPHKGQSLTSFLSSLSDTMPELDRENAHFNVSEALISAFERVAVKLKKDTLLESHPRQGWDFADTRTDDSSIKESQQYIGDMKKKGGKGSPAKQGIRNLEYLEAARKSRLRYTETEDSELEYWKQQPRRPPAHLRKKPRLKPLSSDGHSESILSTTELTSSISSLSSEEDLSKSTFSAEKVALNLLKNVNVRDLRLPEASELRWLVTEVDAPQDLLPMPKKWTSASESEESGSVIFDKSIRLRGTNDWAPPRPQIIFTIHEGPNKQIIESQKYRCLGCGMEVKPKYAGTFKYCYYLGKYFCTGCHTSKKARLPQMILQKWDFNFYPVSNFSATLLESLHTDAVFNVHQLNPNLRNAKLLEFRNHRIQLGILNDYIKNCKDTQAEFRASELYKERKEKFPDYYVTDVDLYSLDDLINVRMSTGRPTIIKEFISRTISHVVNCQRCKGLGFFCEICKKQDVIYPFQIRRVSRCLKCRSCYHLRCFRPEDSNCPKCQRVSSRTSISAFVLA